MKMKKIGPKSASLVPLGSASLEFRTKHFSVLFTQVKAIVIDVLEAAAHQCCGDGFGYCLDDVYLLFDRFTAFLRKVFK